MFVRPVKGWPDSSSEAQRGSLVKAASSSLNFVVAGIQYSRGNHPAWKIAWHDHPRLLASATAALHHHPHFSTETVLNTEHHTYQATVAANSPRQS